METAEKSKEAACSESCFGAFGFQYFYICWSHFDAGSMVWEGNKCPGLLSRIYGTYKTCQVPCVEREYCAKCGHIVP